MGRKITLIFIIAALAGGILIAFRLRDCRQIPQKGRIEAAQVLLQEQADGYIDGDTIYVHGIWGYGYAQNISSGVITDFPICGIPESDWNRNPGVKKVIFGKFARQSEWFVDDGDADNDWRKYEIPLRNRFPGVENIIIEKGNPYLKNGSQTGCVGIQDAVLAKPPYFH